MLKQGRAAASEVSPSFPTHASSTQIEDKRAAGLQLHESVANEAQRLPCAMSRTHGALCVWGMIAHYFLTRHCQSSSAGQQACGNAGKDRGAQGPQKVVRV